MRGNKGLYDARQRERFAYTWVSDNLMQRH